MLVAANLPRVMFAIMAAEDASSCKPPPHILGGGGWGAVSRRRYLNTSGGVVRRSAPSYSCDAFSGERPSECHSAADKPKRHRVNVCLPAAV